MQTATLGYVFRSAECGRGLTEQWKVRLATAWDKQELGWNRGLQSELGVRTNETHYQNAEDI